VHFKNFLNFNHGYLAKLSFAFTKEDTGGFFRENYPHIREIKICEGDET